MFEDMKKSHAQELEQLKGFVNQEHNLVPIEICEVIGRITAECGREIAVYLNRYGRVEYVGVGDATTAPLPQLSVRRGDLSDLAGRLSGLRCIHTHPNGSIRPSEVDLASLKALKLDAMVVCAVNEGRINGVSVSMLQRDDRTKELTHTITFGPYSAKNTRADELWEMLSYIDSEAKSDDSELNQFIAQPERAILVAVDTGKNKNGTAQQLIDELEELSVSAGIIVEDKLIQKRERPETATYIGKGFIEQLSLRIQAERIDVVIFDDELSGAQIRNLELLLGCKVIDRTALILDIFAQRARTAEGRVQVELAQLKYHLPRLIGVGADLAKMKAGVGSRGPGEKKLELDRRTIRHKIHVCEKELKKLKARRTLNRERREKSAIPVITLVGYTNVGKSTLLNYLCKSDVLAENRLFATLDPVTRSYTLPNGRDILLTDTVGFIRKLPHDLIEAFKSTLEEAVHGDVLLNVADASSEDLQNQIDVSFSTLESLKALDKEVILVLNKTDLVDGELPNVRNPYKKTVYVSAKTGEGIRELLEMINVSLPIKSYELEFEIPYSEGWVVDYLHKNGEILESEYLESGSRIVARVPLDKCDKVKNFVVKNTK